MVATNTSTNANADNVSMTTSILVFVIVSPLVFNIVFVVALTRCISENRAEASRKANIVELDGRRL